MRLKKTILFILVFAAVYGFMAVDEAYSDMMDQPGKITLQIRRVNSDYLTLSMFGKNAAINISELKEDWKELSGSVTASLDTAVSEIQGFLGIVEPERDYNVFKTEIL
ncbi:MAG: hypothetical protein K0Q48_2687 [Bacillota bacterium]|jgi:hypothetical protein|nr:hypothetical protein [Bacillota bacterium]